MAVVDSEKMSLKVVNLIAGHQEFCPGFSSGDVGYSGHTVERQEDRYIDVVTGEEMKWSNWSRGEPDGGRKENCVGLSTDGGMWDTSCSTPFCTVCSLGEEPVLHLRGACDEEELDLNYTMRLGGW